MDEEMTAVIEAVVVTVVGLALLPTVTTAIGDALTTNVTTNSHYGGLVTVTYVIPTIYVLLVLGADAALLIRAFR